MCKYFIQTAHLSQGEQHHYEPVSSCECHRARTDHQTYSSRQQPPPWLLVQDKGAKCIGFMKKEGGNGLFSGKSKTVLRILHCNTFVRDTDPLGGQGRPRARTRPSEVSSVSTPILSPVTGEPFPTFAG